MKVATSQYRNTLLQIKGPAFKLLLGYKHKSIDNDILQVAKVKVFIMQNVQFQIRVCLYFWIIAIDALMCTSP